MIEFTCERSNILRSVVRDNTSRKVIRLSDMMQKEPHSALHCNGSMSWDEISSLEYQIVTTQKP